MTAAPPDADGLRGLARQTAGSVSRYGGDRVDERRPVRPRPAGAAGWEVEIADAVKVKGLAPLACKTDKIDAWVLAELSRRDLVPAIWLPTPGVRAERERARLRLHLVRHRTALKNRIHATLLAFGQPCPVSGPVRRRRPAAAGPAGPARAVGRRRRRGLALIDDLDDADRRLRARAAAAGRRPPASAAADDRPRDRPGCWATPSPPRSATSPGSRRPKKLVGYTGLCPRVHQSGSRDQRGPLAKNGPQVPALGADRGGHPRRPPPPLPRPLPADQAPAGSPARRQGRPGRRRPQARRGHLAHAHPTTSPLLRQGPHQRSGRLTTLA